MNLLRPGSLLSLLLCVSMVTPSIGLSSEKKAPHTPQESKQIALQMLQDMEASAAKVLSKVDLKVLNEIDAERTKAAREAIRAQLDATKNNTQAVEKLRDEARAAAVSEAKRSKEELLKKLKTASIETLDRYGKELAKNPAYSSLTQEYAAAYTRTEKVKVLNQVVAQDMDQVLAVTLKRLNWLTPEALRTDLKMMENRIFSGKDEGRKIKRILLIAGAAVAFVGLVTWGVAAGNYSKIRADRRGVLEDGYQRLKSKHLTERNALAAVHKAELDALVARLTTEYNNLNASLTQQEMNFLNSNGYVRMQCNSYTQTSSIICNKYNYQVFSGQTTCTVMCYKNVLQNKETLHETPVCSSPYIPTDCFSQAMYDAEYNAGYHRGYDDYRDDGERDGRDDGEYDGHRDGRNDGDEDGYEDGYDDGFDDGYYDGDLDGYYDGYADRYDNGYNDGYDDGFDDGYEDGYNDYEAGEGSGIMSLLSSNQSSFFSKGYADGFRDAKMMLSFQVSQKASGL